MEMLASNVRLVDEGCCSVLNIARSVTATTSVDVGLADNARNPPLKYLPLVPCNDAHRAMCARLPGFDAAPPISQAEPHIRFAASVHLNRIGKLGKTKPGVVSGDQQFRRRGASDVAILCTAGGLFGGVETERYIDMMVSGKDQRSHCLHGAEITQRS